LGNPVFRIMLKTDSTFARRIAQLVRPLLRKFANRSRLGPDLADCIPRVTTQMIAIGWHDSVPLLKTATFYDLSAAPDA
jgi:hypothetical protein